MEEESEVRLLTRKITIISYLLAIAIFIFLTATESSAQGTIPVEATDQQQAERVLEEYLKFRKSDEPYKRYRLLSNRVKDVLRNESGIDNETKFKEMISDEARWVESRIIGVKTVNDKQITADVYCKVITEYDPGGIVSAYRCEFILTKEPADWRIDSLVIDGRTYIP